MYTFTLRSVSKAALIAAAALSFTACDSGSDVSDADLDDLRDEFDCENVRVIAPTASLNGELTTSDCEDSDNYFDLYAFTIEEDQDVEIEVTSDEYDLDVCLVDDDGDIVDCDFAERRDDARLDFNELRDGTYGIRIRGEEDETGRYTGSLTSE